MANLTNLHQYLPEIYDEVLETDIIMDVEEKLFDFFLTLKDKIVANQYLATLDETGIVTGEKLLGITPLPNDTLDDRRKRIIALKSTKGANDVDTIKTWLNGRIGAENYLFNFSNNHLSVTAYRSDSGLIGDLIRYFKNVLPLNISYSISINTNGDSTANNYIGQAIAQDLLYGIPTKNIIKSDTSVTIYSGNSAMNDVQQEIITHNNITS